MKFFLIIIFLIAIGSAAAQSPLTAIGGTITDANNAPVAGATVQVVCEHNLVNSTNTGTTDSVGAYALYFLSLHCGIGDKVWITADKSSSHGTGTGIIDYNDNCHINSVMADVSIPEFGIVAGAIALIGLVSGVFIMRRRKK